MEILFLDFLSDWGALILLQWKSLPQKEFCLICTNTWEIEVFLLENYIKFFWH